jgi:heat shock protein HslJ
MMTMRSTRILALLLAAPALAVVAACNPQMQQNIQNRIETAAPTLKAAAGTQVSSAMETAGPTVRAAADAAATQIASAMLTAGPTLQAAGTQISGAVQTAGPTIAAAGTQVVGAIQTAGPTLAAAGQAAGFAAVLGQTWAWQSTKGPQGPPQTPNAGATYTVKFNLDGTLHLVADCNSGSGTYTLSGTALTITVGAMTRAACPPGSMSDTFVQQLGQVSDYAIEGELLNLTLADGSTMSFAPAE